MQNEWQKQLLENGVREVVAALKPRLEGSASTAISSVYRSLFEVQLIALGTRQNMASDVFKDIVRDKVAELTALSPSELRQLIRQDTFRSEVLPLDQRIEKVGLSLILGEKVDSATRKSIQDACARIDKLGSSLDREFPELRAELGPKISDSLLDCQFIQNGGTPTSLRLHRAGER